MAYQKPLLNEVKGTVTTSTERIAEICKVVSRPHGRYFRWNKKEICRRATKWRIKNVTRDDGMVKYINDQQKPSNYENDKKTGEAKYCHHFADKKGDQKDPYWQVQATYTTSTIGATSIEKRLLHNNASTSCTHLCSKYSRRVTPTSTECQCTQRPCT